MIWCAYYKNSIVYYYLKYCMRHVYYIKFAYLLLYIKYTVISITKLNINQFKIYMYEREHLCGDLNIFVWKRTYVWGLKCFVWEKYTCGDAFVKISVCMHMFVLSFVLRFNGPVINSSVMSGSSWGAQWLSSRVLDSRPRVRASPVSLHCVLEQDALILT